MIRTKMREAQLLRAAAYIRVSTNIEDQENSFDAQKKYFEELLSKNEQYESAGIYSDYGISGTSIRNREGMQSLLLDCKKGRVNRIYCKSLSRFARNALEFLEILSVLRENGVSVYFEKENLDTARSLNDIVVATLAAIAEEESVSISENTRWANAKWKCRTNCKTDKTVEKLKKGMKRCKSEDLHECAVFQSFMEKLYQIKADIKANDDEAEIIKAYYFLCMERAKDSKSILYRDYTEVTEQIDSVKASIRELAENQKELATVIGEVGMFRSIISDYESELKELEKHKEELITKILLSDSDVKQFDYFVDQILALPDKDANGNLLNIHMVDNPDGITNSIYDLLPFDKAFYLTFIESGTVYGDEIEYRTKFGVSFRTTGNKRRMNDFIDYRKTNSDGESIIIEENYQVYDYQLQYIKRKTG